MTYARPEHHIKLRDQTLSRPTSGTTIHTPWSIAPDPPSATKNSEHAIQAAFICWARKARLLGFELAARPESYKALPPAKFHKPIDDLGLLFAIPNGGLRGKVVAQQLNLEGVRAGVCDVILPVPGSLGYILCLEFKLPERRSNTSADQKTFMAGIQRHAGTAAVVTAWREAAWYVIQHLSNPPQTAMKWVPA